MLGVALFFIGAVLVVNGVALTGRIEPRDAAGLNLLVGLLALLINLAGLVQASAPPQYFSSAGGLLFAFTYLYLAAVQWRGLQGVGLGWYCLFVAISALVYAGTSHDVRVGTMWLMWSSLWFLFFVALGLKRRVRFLPGYTIAIGVGTCWLPGMLMMTGRW
ncbi:AmiS/UreI transporter [Burkholderia pyrrocinia]|uniref:AmiS/UreI family transporter n=1 Tax=Burkholderia pyrrocinia TaxID=60550 RepID=UPI0015754291|nr:AmiS/UreI family transporter [Burkholderia pyrrocinia]NTX32154.1 AmiS/UreI transporter [Burkholderia pyrrocinia]